MSMQNPEQSGENLRKPEIENIDCLNENPIKHDKENAGSPINDDKEDFDKNNLNANRALKNTSDINALWYKYKGYYYKYAMSFYNRYKDRCAGCGVEIDDLFHVCYFALLKAAQRYNQDSEKSLLSFSVYFVRCEFAILMGYRTSRKHALNESMSLNVPLDEEGDSDYLDMVADEQGEAA